MQQNVLHTGWRQAELLMLAFGRSIVNLSASTFSGFGNFTKINHRNSFQVELLPDHSGKSESMYRTMKLLTL